MTVVFFKKRKSIALQTRIRDQWEGKSGASVANLVVYSKAELYKKENCCWRALKHDDEIKGESSLCS